MTRTFVELPSFRTEWKNLNLTEADLRRLQEELLANPEVGSKCRAPAAYAKCALLLSIVEKAAVCA